MCYASCSTHGSACNYACVCVNSSVCFSLFVWHLFEFWYKKFRFFCHFDQNFDFNRYKLISQYFKLPYLTGATVVRVYGALNAVRFNWLDFIDGSNNKQAGRYCSNFPCHQRLDIINGSMSAFVCINIQKRWMWPLNATKLIRIAK